MKRLTGRLLVPVTLICCPALCAGQQLQPGYVDWGETSQKFCSRIDTWQPGEKWSDDDNFFISRVRPKERFRNEATQVNPELTGENDKKLIFWVPINSPEFNAMPDGKFDSEVFPMWSYITHWGNWTAPFIRVPGAFTDVAHRNGVPVSVVASVPYGDITDAWLKALTSLIDADFDKVADYMAYYGVDGLGYNSEWNGPDWLVSGLCDLHDHLVKTLRTSGRNPVFENIWYDGTKEDGIKYFDRGLCELNDEIWGWGDNEKAVLFFNYNWPLTGIVDNSIAYARKLGRTPLDIYCGFDMQGKYPEDPTKRWPLIVDKPVSIGLWGAHAENMLYETRMEQGDYPATRQRTYMLRAEHWFSSGSRNPVNDLPVTNSMDYEVYNTDFFGMSKLVSAKSTLCWDLSDEPFISYFNLGNGTFFNWKGERQHDSEWYNIGVQDYLPTWRWWFTRSFMGRDASDLVKDGLDAEFTWDDAYVGGSTVRVFGSDEGEEYLHLFKTRFALAQGDIITLRYKRHAGDANMALAVSLEGTEATPIHLAVDNAADNVGQWETARFTVGEGDAASLAGKTAAMIALRFNGARDLDLYLGELSIKRPSAASKAPETPVITTARVLSNADDFVDAKIIWEMPNAKGVGEVCYNDEVSTSMFRLWAQQEGCKPVLMGLTTSWAGLMYAIPYDTAKGGMMRFGVSALGLDHEKESDIAFTQYMAINSGIEDIRADGDALIKAGDFGLSFADAATYVAVWDTAGRKLMSVDGPVRSLSTATLAPGVYIVSATVGDTAARLKFTH